MKDRKIVHEVARLNRRVNGGWVTITAHPIFGAGRWIIQIDPITDRQMITIASGFNLSEMIRRAHDWITERATTNGEFQVKPYLDSEEYAAWCRRLTGGRVLTKDNVTG